MFFFFLSISNRVEALLVWFRFFLSEVFLWGLILKGTFEVELMRAFFVFLALF